MFLFSDCLTNIALAVVGRSVVEFVPRSLISQIGGYGCHGNLWVMRFYVAWGESNKDLKLFSVKINLDEKGFTKELVLLR